MGPSTQLPQQHNGTGADAEGEGACGKHTRLKALGFALLLACGIFALVTLPVFTWLIAILAWIRDLGPVWGPIFVLGLYTVGALFCVAQTVLAFGCGALYGVATGLPLCVLGYTLGAGGGFIMGRYASTIPAAVCVRPVILVVPVHQPRGILVVLPGTFSAGASSAGRGSESCGACPCAFSTGSPCFSLRSAA
jgi:hypothetical protein